jgi:hypothetical protein
VLKTMPRQPHSAYQSLRSTIFRIGRLGTPSMPVNSSTRLRRVRKLEGLSSYTTSRVITVR